MYIHIYVYINFHIFIYIHCWEGVVRPSIIKKTEDRTSAKWSFSSTRTGDAPPRKEWQCLQGPVK